MARKGQRARYQTHDGYSVKSLGPCRFVPLVGPGDWDDDGEDHDNEVEFI